MLSLFYVKEAHMNEIKEDSLWVCCPVCYAKTGRSNDLPVMHSTQFSVKNAEQYAVDFLSLRLYENFAVAQSPNFLHPFQELRKIGGADHILLRLLLKPWEYHLPCP